MQAWIYLSSEKIQIRKEKIEWSKIKDQSKNKRLK